MDEWGVESKNLKGLLLVHQLTSKSESFMESLVGIKI